MAKQHSSYETIFICDLTLGEEAVKALVAKFTGMIAAAGRITAVSEWGKRRLAYPINDIAEGYYVLVNFEAPQQFPSELQRVFNITDGIMRSMVIAAPPKAADDAKADVPAAPAEVTIGGDDEPDVKETPKAE